MEAGKERFGGEDGSRLRVSGAVRRAEDRGVPNRRHKLQRRQAPLGGDPRAPSVRREPGARSQRAEEVQSLRRRLFRHRPQPARVPEGGGALVHLQEWRGFGHLLHYGQRQLLSTSHFQCQPGLRTAATELATH